MSRRNAEVFQQLARLAFGIFDKLFVDHSVDHARLTFLKVSHETPVVPVELSHRTEAIRVGNSRRVVMSEIRETACHRVATRVDDLRSRQRKSDQRNVDPVSWQFVDEIGAIRPTKCSRPLQILFAYRRKVRRIKTGDGLAERPTCGTLQTSRKRVHHFKFTGSFDKRVTCQYLLYQRRTGSVETHDKNWIGRIAGLLRRQV